MGWLFGWNTRKELADHLIEGNGVKTIKHCFKGNNIWAVNEYTYPADSSDTERAGKTIRYIIIYLIKGVNTYNARTGRRGGDGWGYKDVDESAGPYYYNCPISYIEMVEAHEREHGYAPHRGAKEWRAAVREKQALASRKLVEGQKIRLYGNEYTVGKKEGRRQYVWMYTTRYNLPPRMMKDVEVLA